MNEISVSSSNRRKYWSATLYRSGDSNIGTTTSRVLPFEHLCGKRKVECEFSRSSLGESTGDAARARNKQGEEEREGERRREGRKRRGEGGMEVLE